MDWHWITKEVTVVEKGKPVAKDVRTARQVDSVGNVFQLHGGVEPKACQQCKKKFVYAVEVKPVQQPVGVYKCEQCDFENGSGDKAFAHTVDNPDHKLKRDKKERVIGSERTMVGDVPQITKTEDDCIILCQSCASK